MREIFIALIMLISFSLFSTVVYSDQSLNVDHQYAQVINNEEALSSNYMVAESPYTVTGESTHPITLENSQTTDTSGIVYYEVGWRSSLKI